MGSRQWQGNVQGHGHGQQARERGRGHWDTGRGQGRAGQGKGQQQGAGYWMIQPGTVGNECRGSVADRLHGGA